jgi:DNA-directed RNA polymerase alpha subunit
MATTLDKYLEELDVIIKDLKRIKHDLETAKSHSISLVVNVSVPEDVTLEDLYKAIRVYSKSSAFNLKEALKSNNITTIAEFVKYRPREILRFKNVGSTTIYNTREAMEDLGILW